MDYTISVQSKTSIWCRL